MAISIQATYRAGVIYPDQPLQLPDDTAVVVTIVPVAGEGAALVDQPTAAQRGPLMAAALERLAASPGRACVDPLQWQREAREDRPLPGRDD